MTPALHPRGSLGAFSLLLRKELLYQRRTRRIHVLALLGGMLVLSSVGVELALPALSASLLATSSPEELGLIIGFLDREPSMIWAAQAYLKNFSFLSIGVLLAGVGCLSTEARTGQLVAVLVRPFSRAQIVVAKWAGLTLAAWSALLLSGGLFVAGAWGPLGPPRPGPLAAMLGALALYLASCAATAVLASALTRSTTAAAAMAAALHLLGNLCGALPWVGALLPEGCFGLAQQAAYGNPVMVAPALIVASNLALLAATLALAGWASRRLEV